MLKLPSIAIIIQKIINIQVTARVCIVDSLSLVGSWQMWLVVTGGDRVEVELIN